jgi:hypothetical protein
MTPRTIALLGGPESGKTTYLGAIIDALDSRALPGLEKVREPEDARTLERLTEPLLDGHYPQRTKGERFSVDLPLRYRDADDLATDFTLSVGDYDGEEVERLFRNRIDGWSAEWRGRAGAGALLLLLRPDAIVPLPLLRRHVTTAAPSRPAPRFGSDPASVFGPGLAQEEVPARRLVAAHEPLRIPTMLALIELLQFIRHARGLAPGERPQLGALRIAVTLGSWDAVDASWRDRGPADYLSQHMPLLVDFLWSNFCPADILHFGLSTTGGDLRNDAHRRRYLERPGGFVEYAEATGEVRRSADLALPIRWALFGDAAMRREP